MGAGGAAVAGSFGQALMNLMAQPKQTTTYVPGSDLMTLLQLAGVNIPQGWTPPVQVSSSLLPAYLSLLGKATTTPAQQPVSYQDAFGLLPPNVQQYYQQQGWTVPTGTFATPEQAAEWRQQMISAASPFIQPPKPQEQPATVPGQQLLDLGPGGTVQPEAQYNLDLAKALTQARLDALKSSVTGDVYTRFMSGQPQPTDLLPPFLVSPFASEAAKAQYTRTVPASPQMQKAGISGPVAEENWAGIQHAALERPATEITVAPERYAPGFSGSGTMTPSEVAQLTESGVLKKPSPTEGLIVRLPDLPDSKYDVADLFGVGSEPMPYEQASALVDLQGKYLGNLKTGAELELSTPQIQEAKVQAQRATWEFDKLQQQYQGTRMTPEEFVQKVTEALGPYVPDLHVVSPIPGPDGKVSWEDGVNMNKDLLGLQAAAQNNKQQSINLKISEATAPAQIAKANSDAQLAELGVQEKGIRVSKLSEQLDAELQQTQANIGHLREGTIQLHLENEFNRQSLDTRLEITQAAARSATAKAIMDETQAAKAEEIVNAGLALTQAQADNVRADVQQKQALLPALTSYWQAQAREKGANATVAEAQASRIQEFMDYQAQEWQAKIKGLLIANGKSEIEASYLAQQLDLNLKLDKAQLDKLTQEIQQGGDLFALTMKELNERINNLKADGQLTQAQADLLKQQTPLLVEKLKADVRLAVATAGKEEIDLKYADDMAAVKLAQELIVQKRMESELQPVQLSKLWTDVLHLPGNPPPGLNLTWSQLVTLLDHLPQNANATTMMRVGDLLKLAGMNTSALPKQALDQQIPISASNILSAVSTFYNRENNDIQNLGSISSAIAALIRAYQPDPSALMIANAVAMSNPQLGEQMWQQASNAARNNMPPEVRNVLDRLVSMLQRQVSGSNTGSVSHSSPVVPTVSGTTTYTVQKGDTLSKIAARFGVSTQDLINANKLANPDVLIPGTPLTIPKGVSNYTDRAMNVLKKTGGDLTKALQATEGVKAEVQRIAKHQMGPPGPYGAAAQALLDEAGGDLNKALQIADAIAAEARRLAGGK